MGSYDGILAKLKQAQQGGTLGSLVGQDDAAKFGNGPLPEDEAGFTAAFGASDLDYLRGMETPTPSPAAGGTATAPASAPMGVPGPGGAPMQGLAQAMSSAEPAPGAGWADQGGGGGGTSRLGQRTPARAAMGGLRAAGRLY